MPEPAVTAREITASNVSGGVLSREHRAMTLGLAFVVTLVAFEALAVATVMPAVEEALGGIGLYGWTFSAFFLTSLLGITVAGRWCDEFGPARPFAAGLVLFGCGLLVAGLAPSMAKANLPDANSLDWVLRKALSAWTSPEYSVASAVWSPPDGAGVGVERAAPVSRL